MRLKDFLLILPCSLLLTVVYQYHVIDWTKFHRIKWSFDFRGEKALAYLGSGWSLPVETKHGKGVFLIGRQAVMSLILKQKDAFSLGLKVKNGHSSAVNIAAFLNNHRLRVLYTKRKKHGDILYLKVCREYTRTGDNELEFSLPRSPSKSVIFVSLKLRNFIGYNNNFPRMAILFDDSTCVSPSSLYGLTSLMIFLILSGCLFLITVVGSHFALSQGEIGHTLPLHNALLCFLPGILLLSVALLASVLTQYHIVFDIWSFLAFSFGLPVIIWGLLYTKKPLLERWPRLRQLLLKVKVWVVGADKRWATSSRTYIIGFMALLISCAFLLVFKAEKAAEQVANVAYFFLVIGVGIEVYRLIRYRSRGDDKGAK